MKWIKSYDLRLTPRHLLENSMNEQLIPDEFLKLADFMVRMGQNVQFIFYGIDTAANEIRTAIPCYYDNTDNCLHLTNMWGVSLRKNPGLIEAIKQAQAEYGAVACKIQRCKVISLEG